LEGRRIGRCRTQGRNKALLRMGIQESVERMKAREWRANFPKSFASNVVNLDTTVVPAASQRCVSFVTVKIMWWKTA
jgi:hypothetical protein